LLRNVFRLDPAQIQSDADLLRALLRRHYSGKVIPKTLDDRLINLLRSSGRWQDWPLDQIVPSRANFLEFLQERWPIFLSQKLDAQVGRLHEAPAPFDLRYSGPKDLPFDHDDVRVYIDNLFTDGLLLALARLCEHHDAYRWLCGGVSVNYHGLSDFRVAHPQLLDQLLIEHVAALSAAGIVDLDEVTQDGLRVRAAAGASSFRREKTLRVELEKARRLVEHLKQEQESDHTASNRRIQAARERAATERKERLEAALAKQAELAAERERRAKKEKAKVAKQKEPRASTTDAESRNMKMADGGFRPAYNCQISAVGGGQVVVAVGVDTMGSDRGMIRPMLEEIQRCYGRRPARHLVDGGFNKNDDTEWAAAVGVDIYGPPMNSKHKTDPYAPRSDDGPGVAAWRQRMNSPQGKEIYKRRALHECINARFRQWGLYQFTVRGSEKIKTVLRWVALANNILTTNRLLKEA
jgi:hypothetical protein